MRRPRVVIVVVVIVTEALLLHRIKQLKIFASLGQNIDAKKKKKKESYPFLTTVTISEG